MKVKSHNKCFPQKMDLDSRNQSSQARPAPEEEVPSLGFPKAVLEVSGKGCVTDGVNLFSVWVSSLHRGHANLLCLVPILVYVLPKQT